MRLSIGIVVLLLAFACCSLGCSDSSTAKTSSSEDKQKLDDDMKKAIEQNKNADKKTDK